MFWAVLGLAGIAGVFLWTRVVPRLTMARGTALVLAALTLGAALPLASASVGAAFASSVLFGASFLIVVTAFTDGVRKTLPPHRWTPAIGQLTAAFATGQCIGPVLAGVLSDTASGVRAGLAVCVGLLVLAIAVALLQRGRRVDTASQESLISGRGVSGTAVTVAA